MARGSLGRERILSGVVGAHQQPGALQEDLNNELLAVSGITTNPNKSFQLG
jgi:hypothetical protein